MSMEYIQVTMLRENFANVPQFPLPAGYSLRLYKPGDKATWLRIWQAAEAKTRLSTINAEMFDKSFGSDLAGMEKRCLFLVDAKGRDIGTTTAWYDRNYHHKAWGRVHWVAILPEFQGKGLAKPMLTAAMNRLKTLGHRRAILGTQAPRLVAIKVYLDVGFVPDMTAKDAQRAWDMIRDALPHPALASSK